MCHCATSKDLKSDGLLSDFNTGVVWVIDVPVNSQHDLVNSEQVSSQK